MIMVGKWGLLLSVQKGAGLLPSRRRNKEPMVSLVKTQDPGQSTAENSPKQIIRAQKELKRA